MKYIKRSQWHTGVSYRRLWSSTFQRILDSQQFTSHRYLCFFFVAIIMISLRHSWCSGAVTVFSTQAGSLSNDMWLDWPTNTGKTHTFAPAHRLCAVEHQHTGGAANTHTLWHWMVSLAVKAQVWIDTVCPYAVAVVFLAGLVHLVTCLDQSMILAVGVSEGTERNTGRFIILKLSLPNYFK